MKKIKENLIIIGLFAFLVLITSIVYTFTIYGNAASMTSINNTILILSVVIFMLFGMIVGHMKSKNGLRNGFIYSLVIVVILFLFSFLGNDEFSFRQIIKYLILLLSSSFGGAVGVNIPKKK
ncbi:TIGR04086 family membrane protein [Mycoplasmatota bacterium WC44]